MTKKENEKASENQEDEQAVPEEEKAQFDEDDEDEEPGEEPEEKPDDEPDGEPDSSPAENRPRKHLEMGKAKFSLSIVIIAAAFFAAGFLVNAPAIVSCDAGVTGQMTSDQAAEFAVGFINDYLLQPGVAAELINASEANGVYEFDMGFISDQGSMVYTSYVTKDGKLLFTNVVDMSETPEVPEEAPQDTPQDTGVPKSDRPQVDVFVMSYCPYGLQMQKAAIPAMGLLKDFADINIRFVYYIMHGQAEIDENTRQYCIQKEQSEKFLDYLDCFTLTDETEACRADAGIDEGMLDACIAVADAEFSITDNYEDTASWLSGSFPLYDVDLLLNEMYGVGGSPTVVINGQQASVNRSPEGFKQAVCEAFNTPPEECSTTLSSEAASPGIGGGTGTASAAGCGA